MTARRTRRIIPGVQTNLVVQLTSFVGRERQLYELRQRLDDVRLLTLVGAGGVGKTRLGLQIAADLLPRFRDGVWNVELAALFVPELVPQAVAAVLGVAEQAGVPVLATLQEALGTRELLVVLDNCEHLIGACAELAESLLRACPRLRIIATSREPLGVAGETVWRVPSLATPDQRSVLGVDEIGASDAVRLFVERARAVLPGFALSDRNAHAVGQICRRLDGIPLAIELAAARVNALGVEQILARLDDRFQLLTAGNRRVLQRHRTLRAAVEWSYELLSESERTLFRRLSVFAGGWTLDAAESVCADADLDAGHVVDLLSMLVDRSLVVVENQETVARYGLLETLRQFAAEHLQQAGEKRGVRERHAAFYLDLARRADGGLRGPDQARWIGVLDAEHDNARGALQWSLESGAIDQLFALALAYAYFWEIRGHRFRTEARTWLDLALGLPPTDLDVDAKLRASALYWAGTFAAEQFDFLTAASLLEEDAQLCRQQADARGLSDALLGLAQVAVKQGDATRATAALAESLTLSRQLAEPRQVALVLRSLGTVARGEGESSRALDYLRESLGLFQAIGESHQVGHVLDQVGEAERDLRHLGASARAHREAIQLLAAAGCEEGLNTSKYRQACLARAQGQTAEALTLALESLRGYRLLGNGRDLPSGLELVAQIMAAQQPEHAAQLLGAASGLRDKLRLPLRHVDTAACRTAIDTVEAALGSLCFGEAWSAGGRLTLDAAIELALRSTLPPSAGFTDTAEPGPDLTVREWEVAELIGRGYTNKEIAGVLVVSTRTVESHVTNVLRKLDLRSRAQLAAWLVEQRRAPRTDA